MEAKKERIRTGWLAFMILAGIILTVGLGLVGSAYAQEVSTISDYQDNLSVFFGFPNNINIFFPIFFIVIVFVFMAYVVSHRHDSLSAVFSLASFVILLVLSFMFISPAEFDTVSITTTTEVISDPSNNVFTSVKTTENRQVVIPNDTQFRFILSSLFSLFSIFAAMTTIMVFTMWRPEKQ